jgi:hypothetical protein
VRGPAAVGEGPAGRNKQVALEIDAAELSSAGLRRLRPSP